ncbi:MAG: carboxylating nicotinate-nucleotide diphosphorylase [Chloroflexota bacterium]
MSASDFGLVELAIAEDIGRGDVTTTALIPADLQGEAAILVKANGVLSGTRAFKTVYRRIDQSVRVTFKRRDGDRVRSGDIVGTVRGSYASILCGERTALNFLQHLSGIATATSEYVEAVSGLPTKILDTRKTSPGMRALEKAAVKAGGGVNHRMGLYDALLIKDNHLSVLRRQGLSIARILHKARAAHPCLMLEIEVRSAREARAAADAGADIIMLDNMSLTDMRKAVKAVRGKALIEASGGMTLDRVRAVAKTGVDFISIGAITHSAKALDISLEVELVK